MCIGSNFPHVAVMPKRGVVPPLWYRAVRPGRVSPQSCLFHHVPVLGAPARASRCCRDAWRERKARLSRLGSIPAAAEGSIQPLVQGTHTLLYSLCRISRPCYGAARGGFLSARRVLRTSEPAPADGATWTPWQGAEQSARPGTADGPSAVFGLPDPCAAQASTSPP